MTTAALDTAGLNDFFRPLDLDGTRTSPPRTSADKNEDIPLKSRSIKFADEKEDAKILLETILLFENDESFCDASVVEAVMEEFQDSCSSFDSWEYAHGGNVRDLLGDSDHSKDTLPSLSLTEIELLVREQQARELLEKAELVNNKKPAIPLEIMAALGDATNNSKSQGAAPDNNNGLQNKSVQLVSPLSSPMVSKGRLGPNRGSNGVINKTNIHNICSPGVANPYPNQLEQKAEMDDDEARIGGRKLKPKRSISSHKAIPKTHPRGAPASRGSKNNPNLRRALEKSSSLRMLEEAAANKRAREEEIRQRQAAERILAEQKAEEEDEERLRQEEALSKLKQRQASEPNLNQEEPKEPAAKQENNPPLKRASTHQPFTTPVKKEEEEEKTPTEESGAGLRRTKTSDEPPITRTGRNPLRRNRTFDVGAAKPTKAPPKRTASNFTGPRNMQLRRVRTHEPMMRKGPQLQITEEETKEATEEIIGASPAVEKKDASLAELPVGEKKKLPPTEAQKQPTPPTRRPRRVAPAATPTEEKKETAEKKEAPERNEVPIVAFKVAKTPLRVSSEGVASLRSKLEQQPASFAMEIAEASQQKRNTESMNPAARRESTPQRAYSTASAENAKLAQQKRSAELQATTRRDSLTTQTQASSSSGAENAKLAQQKRIAELQAAAGRDPLSNQSKASSAAAENAKLAQQKRIAELQAVQGLSVVGANAFNARERMVVTLQSTTRGFLLRHAINSAQAKIKHLQNHLKAMERSKQHELMSIRNGPQLKALREEYQAATMTVKEIDLEKKRSELKGDLLSVIDQNADIQQKMEDLQENNRRIVKVNRELNYQITLLEDRNATLHATRDHLQGKVDQLRAKKKAQEEEIATTIRQTQTEKKVGRICHSTILRIREQTKVVAAKSDDVFLKKVHRRAQILDRINAPRRQGTREACPVILSG